MSAKIWDPRKHNFCIGRATATASRTKATQIAKQWARDFIEGQRSAKSWTLVEYVGLIWDWEKSPRVIFMRNLGSDAISEQYVRIIHGSVQKHATAYFKQLKLTEITGTLLRGFWVFLKDRQGLSNSTAKNIIGAVQTALRFAHSEGLIPSDPSDLGVAISRQGTARDTFTTKEINGLHWHSWDCEMSKTAFLVACHGGLRIGEIRALKVQDLQQTGVLVDESFNQLVGLKCTKNRKTRVVPMLDEVLERLQALAVGKTNSDFLFAPSGSLVPTSDRILRKHLKSAMLSVGISTDEQAQRLLGFHSARHWCNTTIRGSIPESVLRKTIGHSSSAMSDRYDHLMLEEIPIVRAAQELRAKELLLW